MHISKNKVIGMLAVLLALVVAILGLLYVLRMSSPQRVIVGGTTYKLQTVTSIVAQEKGLGDRSSLAPGSGMLFQYDQVAQRCMWMKDMRFAIDIVWLDSNQRVTDIEANLSPATYPQVYCASAEYVAELPAGSVGHASLTIGHVVRFIR